MPVVQIGREGAAIFAGEQGASATAALSHFLLGLRGVAGAEAHGAHTSTVLHGLGLLEVLPLLAPLLEGCAAAAPPRAAAEVVVGALKLLATLVDAHGDDLGEITEPSCAAVYEASRTSLEAVGRVAPTVVGGEDEAARQLRYRVVKALLKVSMVFWPRALYGEEGGEAEAVGALLFGLVTVLLPLVDTPLLQVTLHISIPIFETCSWLTLKKSAPS